MSVIIVLAPVIIGGWPAIAAAAAAAAAAMGYAAKEAVATEAKVGVAAQAAQAEHTVEVSMNDSEVAAQGLVTGQEMVVQKGTIQLRVHRDERGHCVVCAKGLGHTDTELRIAAEEFMQRMTQCYMYNKVMTELKGRGFQVVNEEVANDESVRIHVRHWEG